MDYFKLVCALTRAEAERLQEENMKRSNPYSAKDPYGCRADYEWEQIQEARRLRHLEGECTPSVCDFCEDDRRRARESNGG